MRQFSISVCTPTALIMSLLEALKRGSPTNAIGPNGDGEQQQQSFLKSQLSSQTLDELFMNLL
jgi:hypothetical protein